jgi:hypothetical protein
MNRIVKSGLTLFLAFLIPSGILTAQDNKNEQRIKIIVAGNSGTKIEIDTLIKGDAAADSIKLKNGKVIYLARHDAAGISDDSAHVHQVGEGSNVIIVKGGKHFTEGKGGRVVTWSSSEGDLNGERIIYINEGKDSGKNGEKTVNVEVSTDKKGPTIEKTKYVIAKDGMVISIEGNDEAKVKELVKDVESKLGVSKEDKKMKQVVKEEKKKTTKK